MKLLLLIIVLALPLAAQDAKLTPEDIDRRAAEYSTLKARIAELEKQLAQQGALSQEFATQASNCNVTLTVYKVTHPDQKAEAKEQSK